MSMVTIKNTLRNRLGFKTPGMTISMGPGKTVELSKEHLDTPELKKLIAERAVLVLMPAEKKIKEKEGASDDEAKKPETEEGSEKPHRGKKHDGGKK